MVYEIRTIYPGRLDKRFGSKFHVGYRFQQETSEEGRKTHRPKRCKYNHKDEDNSPNSLNDKI